MDKTEIISVLMFAAIIGIFGMILLQGIEKAERVECIGWQQEAMRFKDVGWYPSDWQKEQCRQYNIEL